MLVVLVMIYFGIISPIKGVGIVNISIVDLCIGKKKVKLNKS